MKILNYSSLTVSESMYYKYNLAVSLLEYFKERHSDTYKGTLDNAITMLDYLEGNNYLVYFVVDENNNDIVVGFVILHIDNQWSMVEDYLVCDYMYIHPNYRKGKATRLLFITVGKISNNLRLDVIGCTLLGKDNNSHNVSHVGGEVIGLLQSIKRQDFNNKYTKYMKGYK